MGCRISADDTAPSGNEHADVVIVGVAAATTSVPAILTAGAAAMIGGAISMALGEYVSVSSSKDTTQALIAKERWELANDPDGKYEKILRRWTLTRPREQSTSCKV